MDNLGEDIALLALTPKLVRPAGLRYALMGSELVQLAARGRITITGDLVEVRDASPTGDAELDTALTSLAVDDRHPSARQWVQAPRPAIIESYLARLARQGAARREKRGLYTVWVLADPERQARLRGVLDAIARSNEALTTDEATFAALVYAAGLIFPLYGEPRPKFLKTMKMMIRNDPNFMQAASAHLPMLQRFEKIAQGVLSQPAFDPSPGSSGQPSGFGFDPAAPATGTATGTAAGAAGHAAREAARHAVHEAAHAATHAATQAAVHAATQAATQAAVHAATEAAVHAATEAAARDAAEAAAHHHDHGGGGGGDSGGGHHHH